MASTNQGDIILDPFNGGGTTGAACCIIGDRYYIGIEIDQAFCELSKKRFQMVEENL
jgi:site-specific DNA-methyltransferase (adenine-specific)